MKKISIPACLCACLLTLCLTLTAVFIWQRILPRHDRGDYTAEDKLAEAADIIRENYIGEYEESELTDRAIDAMVASLGPDRVELFQRLAVLRGHARDCLAASRGKLRVEQAH